MPNIIIGKDEVFSNGFFGSDSQQPPVTASLSYVANNISANDGQGLTGWPETNNAAYDLSVSGSGQNPTYEENQLNGNAAVRFYRSQNEMTVNVNPLFNGITGMSMYMAYEPVSLSGIGFDTLCEFRDSGDRITINRRNFSQQKIAYSVDGGSGTSTNLTAKDGFRIGIRYVFKWVHKPDGSVEIAIYPEDGIGTPTDSFTRTFPTKNRPTFLVGATIREFDGYISEIAAYNRDLSASEDGTVTTYFRNKYNV